MLQCADDEIDSTLARMRDTAAAPGEYTAAETAIINRYVQSLGLTERAMFLAKQSGLTTREISEEMGIDLTAVCRTLARLYSGLRVSLEPSG